MAKLPRDKERCTIHSLLLGCAAFRRSKVKFTTIGQQRLDDNPSPFPHKFNSGWLKFACFILQVLFLFFFISLIARQTSCAAGHVAPCSSDPWPHRRALPLKPPHTKPSAVIL